MAFDRYGLTPRPDDPAKPQQYVVDAAGNWTMNCLACHQGKVAGKVIPGVPNTLLASESLTEETREVKKKLGKKLTRMDIGFMVMPLGSTVGTTNAVNFGVALMAQRDAELNVLPLARPPLMKHHDHDAPAWWLLHRKQLMYIDAFVPKSHRAIMQFILVKENGPQKFTQWEDDFNDIFAWLESLQPPQYPFAIDAKLAAAGQGIFTQHCADCHGTYGAQGHYPGKVVPIDEIGTDKVRFDSLARRHRESYGKSWFAALDKDQTILEPKGYAAPPLDGVWATAPYFHNGSVPTL